VASKRPGLWADVALALALITLASILLNGGVFWLVGQQATVDRQTALGLSMGRVLRAQLEAAGPDEESWKRIVTSYRRGGVEADALWVTSPALQRVAGIAGQVPDTPDSGLRRALHLKEEHIEVVGRLGLTPVVAVTEPIVNAGAVVGALRVELSATDTGLPGGRVGFLVFYTLVTGGLVAAFGYAILRQRLIDPVRAVRDATRRIADGELGLSLELDSAREIHELCDALNAMSASLADYRSRTAEHVEHLEAANAELRRVQEELVRSEKLAGVGRLAAGVAHEIGNPLAAVVGYTELLAGGLDDAELEGDLLARSNKELERIQTIVRGLLDYARPGEATVQPTSVRQLLHEAVDTVALQPTFRGVSVEVHVAPECPAVMVEAQKIHQVLVNVLLNAADAIGGAGEVTLTAAPSDGLVEIACRDTGPGFAPGTIGLVFDPFYTTKEPGQGTGLGLAICQRIVEDDGGWIRAENSSRGGALVTLGLPTP